LGDAEGDGIVGALVGLDDGGLVTEFAVGLELVGWVLGDAEGDWVLGALVGLDDGGLVTGLAVGLELVG
jgi:hypothetical protein